MTGGVDRRRDRYGRIVFGGDDRQLAFAAAQRRTGRIVEDQVVGPHGIGGEAQVGIGTELGVE